MVSTSFDAFIRNRRTKYFANSLPCMTVDPYGCVQCNKFGCAGDGERITVQLTAPWWWPRANSGTTEVALQAWTGKYFTVHPDGDVDANARSVGEYEKFVLEKVPPYIALKSKKTGKYLACDAFDNTSCGKGVRASRFRPGVREHWLLTDQPECSSPGLAGRVIAGTALFLGTAACLGAFSIPALGFGAVGVAKGSGAAAAQSAIYAGATTGIFSVLQSCGAKMAWVPVAKWAGTAAGAAGAALAASSVYKKGREATAIGLLDRHEAALAANQKAEIWLHGSSMQGTMY